MEEQTEGKTRRRKSNRRKVNHISASMKREQKDLLQELWNFKFFSLC